MELIVRGEKKEFHEEITVEELLKIEEVKTPQYVTVQVNEDLVDQKDFTTTRLSPGDRVEFLYFMGGGMIPWF